MHVINTFEAPTLYNEAGEPIIASRGFKVVKFADHEAERERLVELLRDWRESIGHEEHFDHPAHGNCLGWDTRCDLCTRTDAALAKENHHE